MEGATNWPGIIRGSLIWAVTYSALGAVLMVSFMGREFMKELERIGRPLQLTAGVVAFLVPFGLIFTIGWGLTAVWLYAAIRPRYGAGARTAVRAAVVVWLLSVVAPLSHLAAFGVTSVRFVIVDVCGELPLIVIATLAAARQYKE